MALPSQATVRPVFVVSQRPTFSDLTNFPRTAENVSVQDFGAISLIEAKEMLKGYNKYDWYDGIEKQSLERWLVLQPHSVERQDQ